MSVRGEVNGHGKTGLLAKGTKEKVIFYPQTYFFPENLLPKIVCFRKLDIVKRDTFYVN